MQHEERSGLNTGTPTDATPTRDDGTVNQERQTIAQTAHALLRRWEESRAQAGLAESRPSYAESLLEATDEVETLGESYLSEQIPTTREQAWNTPSTEPAGMPASQPTLQKTAPTRSASPPAIPGPETPAESGFSPAKFASLEKTTGPATTSKPTDSSDHMGDGLGSGGGSDRPAEFSPRMRTRAESLPTGELPTPSGETQTEFRSSQRVTKSPPLEQPSNHDRPQETTKSPVREQRATSPASANDASQLLRARGMALPESEMKNHDSHRVSPSAEAPQESTPPLQSRGEVKFATREQGNPQEEVEFDIHQAIERNCRKQRNWSAILGQLLSLGGALAMTGGFAVVLGNWFGKIDVPETTGWLAVAGGHLLFVLGLYTHLTSRIEQVWHELHGRSDDLQRLLLQMQRMQQLQLSRPTRETSTRTSPAERPEREPTPGFSNRETTPLGKF